MAQTVANLADVLKEAWTSDRLEKQFLDDHPLLERIERQQATMIGEHALVPIHKGRSGGYTSTSAAGGSLNPADEQKVDQALYTLVYHWFQIALETGALNQSNGNSQSAVVAKDLEIQGAIENMRNQAARQLATNGDGIVAACDSGGASTTVELLVDSATSYGYQAIAKGWLYPGLLVDVGTTADTDALATGSEITAVKESETDPDITISNSITTVSGTHFVYIANPNSTTAASPELNGLRNIVGSSSALGGLNPANAGEEWWAPAYVDTTTTTFSLDLALLLQRKVFQKGGKYSTSVWTSPKQQANFYSLLQNQVRFAGEANLGAGNVDSPKWNGLEVNAINDLLDTDWYHLTLEDFRLITGSIKKPTWASDLEGAGGRLRWQQGATGFVDGVTYPFQIAVVRRNRQAAAIGLTA